MSAPTLERTSHFSTLIFAKGWWPRLRGTAAWLECYNDIATDEHVRGERFELVQLITDAHIRDSQDNPVYAIVGTADRTIQMVLIWTNGDMGPRIECRDPEPDELGRLLAA